ncbi:MAG: acyl carrier protein [Proteobacteria bacterium]|nr:acyl carrier protein [Pseudomonadota bacterium]
MATEKEIYAEVTDILRQISSTVSESDIHPEMSLINDLSIDSIKVAELSILLEDSFHCPVFIPELLGNYRDPYEITVGALVDFVKQQLGN